tara:strand:- start:3079 stop:5574 length:2496 start_codon:yes stop_codon:yes gene_type:complete
MAEQQYQESNYRFSDPVRLFKANDPYYFEVDNIPLKQLQENCLWLKDQVRKDTNKLLGVKRSDIDELRPYSTGSDRLVRVKPGRYTARINDASNRTPLAYLRKVMGEALGDVDAWSALTPNQGSDPKNAVLEAALLSFQEAVSETALGMNGLVERAFTRPLVDVDRLIDVDGADIAPSTSWLSYGGYDENIPGGGAALSPFIITEAIAWARSQNSEIGSFVLPTYEITNPNNGFAKIPLTESYFIKAWRGVSRLAVVDVDDELTIQVPNFDAEDFYYTDSAGTRTEVTNVQQRVDLVFIYSKSVDTSSATIMRSGAKETITKPTLGIVKGAGIRATFEEKNSDLAAGYKVPSNDSILASPSDQLNVDMGFTSTSSNDIAVSVRGSFPAPDDLMNLAPLLSEKLEDSAYELIGQSILPVAYVFVQGGSQVVLSTDVIDIRPLFRTAELAYNERAGIGAAFPQLSLANPAVGKGQLDLEIRRVYDSLENRINTVASQTDTATQMNTLAAGYVFGGWNFGPEGALYDYYKSSFGQNENPDDDSEEYIKQYIRGKYGIGNTGVNITVPSYPDWDLAQWCIEQPIEDKGLFPNDYVNTFFSLTSTSAEDPTIAVGSFSDGINSDGTSIAGNDPPSRLKNFSNTKTRTSDGESLVNFHYISKKIKFQRPAWLADYAVDTSLINSLAQNNAGTGPNSNTCGSYFGCWVEKGFDEFTIYVAFSADTNNNYGNASTPRFPAPHSLVYNSGGKKKKTTSTLNVSQRDGDRFSGFVVPVSDILYSNTEPASTSNGFGYVGNPRIGKCTYPTVMWKITGVPNEDAGFLYGNLNGTNPVISLKG